MKAFEATTSVDCPTCDAKASELCRSLVVEQGEIRPGPHRTDPHKDRTAESREAYRRIGLLPRAGTVRA